VATGPTRRTPGSSIGSPGGASARPKLRAQNPRQGEHDNLFRYATKELRSITTPYTTNNEMAELHLVPGSREATPSSGKEKPSDVAIHSAKEGAKNGRKSLKHRPQGTTTMTDLDDGDDGKVGGYGGGAP
jgi:hypothetical protein